MTVSSNVRKAGPFNGNGIATSFTFSFKVFAASDLGVIRTNLLGSNTVLVLGINYNVTLNPDQNATPGGSIAYPISGLPLAIGEKLTAIGNLAYLQLSD